MESLKGKIVFITGASSGIGKACAESFASLGAKLIISSRGFDKLEHLAVELKEKYNSEVHYASLDVRDIKSVQKFYNALPDDWKRIDILVNNAGLARGFNKLYEDDIAGWEEMIDTNVKGVLYITRTVVPGMVERESGHVINLGSIAGHQAYPKGAVYCASKHALDAITNSLRQDVIDKNIRVSTVDPGMVETNFSNIRFYGDEEKAKNVYKGLTPLFAGDIADAVIYCATRPPHANINEMVIMPSAQANSYVNYRKN
ncbi:MAG: SDR family NAD(P)-dependent oxidoreductase [Melioribacteraceae bacterium]|nr:SDR family NAD(P)-dependent oxidoreductase [Melioribacteraceae bacterium]